MPKRLESQSVFIMKFSLSLPLCVLFATAASAFGLNGGAKSVLSKAQQAFVPKAPASMVQAVNIQGNRMNSVVSYLIVLCKKRSHVAMVSILEVQGSEKGLGLAAEDIHIFHQTSTTFSPEI